MLEDIEKIAKHYWESNDPKIIRLADIDIKKYKKYYQRVPSKYINVNSIGIINYNGRPIHNVSYSYPILITKYAICIRIYPSEIRHYFYKCNGKWIYQFGLCAIDSINPFEKLRELLNESSRAYSQYL